MDVMSFAHLKDKNRKKPGKQHIVTPQARATKQPPGEDKNREVPVQDLPLHGNFHSPDFNGEIDVMAPLMESKFCYGCDKFSVDFPGTEKEAGFCFREMDPGDGLFEVVFKKIKEHFKVGQCPKVKEWKAKKKEQLKKTH